MYRQKKKNAYISSSNSTYSTPVHIYSVEDTSQEKKEIKQIYSEMGVD